MDAHELNFGFGRKTPLILQSEAAECGLACLGMVAGYHGFDTDLASLRQRFSISLRGVTLNQMIEIAAELKLSSRAVRLELANLSELKCPAILHWDFNHFVVLTAVGKSSIEILDLRTIIPWDKEAVLESIKKTNRAIILCEDNWTCNFAAEICATITQEAFEYLDAPIERLSTPDCPIPYNVGLMDAVLPGVEEIGRVIERVLRF